MPLILPGNVASATAGGYEVANSCRFNDGDSPKLTRTNSSDGSLTNWTFSIWIKRANITGSTMRILHCRNSGGTLEASIYISGGNQLNFYATDGSNVDQIGTNRKFRDSSAWYNIVVVWDSDNATAGNRMRFFINGTEETSLATDNNPAEDQESMMSKGTAAPTIGIGYESVGDSDYCDMYFAEAVFLDGTAVTDATDFGEFDSDSPTIWKPKDVSGLTFGSHGWYLDFADSADLGDDESGNGNDFTEANLAAADQATDTPTNSFATLNPLYFAAASYTIEEGNLQITANASNAWRSLYTTMPVTNGKWYFEVKVDAINAGDADNIVIGIVDIEQVVQTSSNGKFFGTSRGYGYHAKDGQKLTNDTVTDNGVDYGDAYTAGDIVGCAFDLDNQKIYWSKNGTFQDSGDPTTGATGTGSAFDIGSGYTYTPVIANYYTGEHYSFNFGGCPAFSISSGNADGNGYGNFEYAVPSGYYALCTKNLAEYG